MAFYCTIVQFALCVDRHVMATAEMRGWLRGNYLGTVFLGCTASGQIKTFFLSNLSSDAVP